MRKKIARALLAGIVLVSLALAWFAHVARASVYERALDLADELLQSLGREPMSAPTTLELNGQIVHASAGQTRCTVAGLLDDREHGLGGARLRFGDADRGLVVALERGPDDWIDRLWRDDGGTDLGAVRLVYAARAGEGATRFLLLWTDAEFSPERMFSASGDAPGFDLATVPRLPGSRRLLAARERPGPFRLVVYETALSAPTAATWYAAGMPASGWRALPAGRPDAAQRFVRGTDEATLVCSARPEGGSRVVAVVRESPTAPRLTR
jgi:hypothetical protein